MNKWHLKLAAQHVRQGHIIAYPTEGVYGLGCDPLNQTAVMRLLAIKQRHWKKGLILIAANFDQLRPFLQPLPADVEEKILSSWAQGQVITWLLPAHPAVPLWLRGQSDKLAVRITHHPQAHALCQTCDMPLVSTSANLAGKVSAKTAFQVARIFQHQVDYILNGKIGNRTRPSEIRDAITQTILRAG